MSTDKNRLIFILEKIEDISMYKSNFNSIKELLDDKMGFDATLMCLLQIGEKVVVVT